MLESGEGVNVGKPGDGTKTASRGSAMARTDELWLAPIASLAEATQDTQVARRSFLSTPSA